MKNSQLEQNEIVDWNIEQISELGKCINDPIYFAENHFVIKNLSEGNHKIKLYDWQKKAIRQYLNNKNNIYCASRQLGKTTVICILALWKALFSNYSTIQIATLKHDQAEDIMTILQRALEYLPEWLKPKTVKFNREQIKFENDSLLRVSMISAEAFRGLTINHIFIDEYGHVPEEKAIDFFLSIIPCVSSSNKSKLTIFSTASKKPTHKFHQLFNAVKRGENQSWAASSYDWTAHPLRDEAWKKDMQTLLDDPIVWEREYENAFID